MLARLGRVLYWTTCGVAAVVFVLGTFMAAYAYPGTFTPSIAVGCAVISGLIWLFGRGTLYVLAGK